MYYVVCVDSTLLLNEVEMRYNLYNVHCTVYIVQCTLYSVHCTVYIVQCTLYSVHCTVYIVQCTLYKGMVGYIVHTA